MNTETEPLPGVAQAPEAPTEGGTEWRGLVIGLAGLLVGLVPLVVRAASQSPGPSWDSPFNMFAYDVWLQNAVITMPWAFAGVGLHLWRRHRGPVPSRTAALGVGMGLLLVLIASLVGLFGELDVAGGDLKEEQQFRLMFVAFTVVGSLLLGAVSFWLLAKPNTTTFVVGTGVAYLPATSWLLALVTGLGAVGEAMLPYAPYALAAVVGLVLGRCGWKSARKMAAWAFVLLIMTVGYAGLAWITYWVMGVSEHFVFWQALASSLPVAGIALAVGLVVGLMRMRREDPEVDLDQEDPR
ncbi:MAG: hypothetical protein Q4G35_12565 [Propionibacteriaceae bacterium]|nr:hypothetical protein [Propionibacteriaceae bacterium]